MPCPDLDGNRTVNVADVVIESTYVGLSVPPAPLQADMNRDRDIDQDDLAYFTPPLLPPEEYIASCQDKPIGPAGAVGGISELAHVAVPQGGDDWAGWLALAELALSALAVFAVWRLRRSE
jgi:hypothetical protein